MLQRFQSLDPVYRFLILFGTLALVWYFLYQLVILPYTNLDMFVVDVTISFSKGVLELFGFSVFTETRVIRIAGTSGLWIGNNCDALSLFALFTGFILAFPGKVKSKYWYIPLGITLIFLVNSFRIVALAIIDTYSREWTKFNHSYTFNIIIYGFILLLWMYWVNRFSFAKKSERKQQ